MSTLRTTSSGQKAWLVHDGFGGHLFDVYASKTDANYVRRWHGRSRNGRDIQIQEIDLRVVVPGGRDF